MSRALATANPTSMRSVFRHAQVFPVRCYMQNAFGRFRRTNSAPLMVMQADCWHVSLQIVLALRRAANVWSSTRVICLPLLYRQRQFGRRRSPQPEKTVPFKNI